MQNIDNMAPKSSPSKRSTLNKEKLNKITNAISNLVCSAKKHKSAKHTPTNGKKLSGFSLFKPFGCGQCRMRFVQMDQLQKHVRFHEQEKKLLSSKDLPITKKKNITSITCCFPGCDKVLNSRKALGNHIRKIHPSG